MSITEKAYDFLDKSIPWLVGIFLFFNPFPHTTAISEISFYLCMLIFLILLFTGKRKFSFRTPLSVPFVLFFLWSCFGLIFALNKPNTLHDIYAHLFKYIFIYYMIINSFDSKKGFKTLAWIVAISTSIYVIVVMADYYIVKNRDLTGLLGYGFPESSSNILALVVIFGFLLLLFLLSAKNPLYQNIILTLCSFLSLFAVVMTQSRSGILSLGAAILVVFPKRKKILLYFVVAVVVVIMGVVVVKKPEGSIGYLPKIKSGDMASVKDRVGIWLCFAEIVKDHPIVGIGFGMQTSYDTNLISKYNQRVAKEYRMTHLYTAPHNIIVDVATRLGLVGLAIFFYIIFAFFRMGWRLILNGRGEFIRYWGLGLMGASIAVFLQGMFENTLSGPPAVILYVIFGLMTILWRINNQTTTA
jgi:O-antigen ligase